jgi:hypothetical protein
LTSTDLTTGRVVFTSTDGQLVDNAGLTFSANTVTVGGSATITIDGDTATIATTDEDQDLILAPNGDGAVDFNAANAVNLADPVDPQDAVTLAYLESFASSSITGISEDDSDVTVTDGGGAGGTITANVDGTLATLINSSKAEFFEGQLIITPDDGTSTPSVLTVSNATAATSTTTGAVQVTGGVGVQGNVVVGGQVISTSVDQSTNSTSGAIVTAGGVGIAKNLNVGGDAVITGNLTVQGTTTAVQSQTLDVTDLNITIAKGAVDSAAANGAGLTVDGADATLLYTHATTSWNFNKLVIATGLNTTGNVSGAVVDAGALNVTGTTTVANVNSTGFINTTANVSAAVVNAGALNATGTTTVVDVNATGFINTSANVSAAIVNTGALNATGLINTTGNVIAAVATFSSATVNGDVTIYEGNLIAGGTNGTNGQVLASTGTGLVWQTLAATADKIFAGGSNVTVTADYVNVSVQGTQVASFDPTGLNGTAIGATSESTGKFTTLQATSTVTLDDYTGYVYANAGNAITASTTIPNTDITGLGTISTQDADSVSITGGSVDGTTIGATTASTGKFTDLDATGTVYANATTDTSSLTTGAVVVAGGVAVGKTLYVGEGAVINSTQTNENFQVYGNVATTLIYADSVNNSVTLGGSNVTATVGATVVINSTDTMLLPRGATSARPSNAGGADVPGMIRYNTSLNDVEYYTASGWTTPGATVSLVTDNQFNGDGTTTQFNLTANATTNSTLVSVNGVLQSPTLAYAVSGTTVTFTEAPEVGDLINVRVLTISTTFDTLASSNGFTSFNVSDANNNFANITSGLSSATVRLSADAGGNLTIANGTKLTYEQAAVSVTTSPTTVDAFDKTAFRAAKYIVTFTNGTTSYETAEILVIHDGTTATRTVYGSISTSGSDLGTYTVTISGDEVLLQCAAVSGTGTVKAMATYIRA